MRFADAQQLREAIKEEFPRRFLVAVRHRGADGVCLAVKERGGGPHDPTKSLFKGPPAFVYEPHEWPEIAAKRFGIKVVGV